MEANVREFIEDIKPNLKKELKFLTTTDWTSEKSRSKRKELHKLENLITNRAIQNAKTLYNLAGDDVDNPEISKVMTDLLSFYEISKSRFDLYTKAEDWTTYLKDDKKSEDVAAEIEFQSDVQQKIISLRNTLKDINFGNANNTLEIKTYGNQPIPLLMFAKALRRLPEIKDYLEKNDKQGIFDDEV